MRTLLASLLVLCLIISSHTQTYDVDNAQQLIVQLKQEAEESLKELDSEWLENKKLLQQNVASWETSQANQAQECLAKNGSVAEVVAKQAENNKFIDWISQKIADGTERYNSIYSERCKANRNYIKSLGNNKVMIGLLEFLRAAISSREEISFAQRRDFITQIFTFVQLYESKNMQAMMQMKARLERSLNQQVNASDYEVNVDTSTKARTAEEIGDKQKDVKREDLSLQGFSSGSRRPWAEYKKDILELIDTYLTHIKDTMKQSQEDEIQAGISAAEFRETLEHELQELDRELYKQIVLTSELQARFVEVNTIAKRCLADQKKIDSGLENSKSEYNLKLDDFNTKSQAKQEEIAIFQEVHTLYSDSVHSQNFTEPTDKKDREIDKINYIGDEPSGTSNSTAASTVAF